MKKTLILLSFILLTSCAHWADYQPKLANEPLDKTKYEADRKACLEETLVRKSKADPFFSSDGNKTSRQIADECIAAKGYNVIKVEHCC